MATHTTTHVGGPEIIGAALGMLISVPWLAIIGWRRIVNRYRL